jgi:hypothetical protein
VNKLPSVRCTRESPAGMWNTDEVEGPLVPGLVEETPLQADRDMFSLFGLLLSLCVYRFDPVLWGRVAVVCC